MRGKSGRASERVPGSLAFVECRRYNYGVRGAIYFTWLLGIGSASVGVYLAGDSSPRLLEALLQSSPWKSVLRVGTALLLCSCVFGVLGMFAAMRPRGAFSPEPHLLAGSHALLREVRARIERYLGDSVVDSVRVLDEILLGAYASSASDIHLSPNAESGFLTYRIDGELHQVCELPGPVTRQLTNRVKVLAHLRLEQKNSPQDGRLSRLLDGRALELRVSTLPTEFGERLVLRLVHGGEVPRLDSLGLDRPTLGQLSALIKRPQGLLFVTGPVGSGKSTTLYAALRQIHVERGQSTSMVTLEDPIERQLSFLTQSQINQVAGMSFAQTLRSVLRQDPNVLMVGEIRDAETAEVAVQAGLTGHLILTTVHANEAAGAFTRLVEMGVEPFALASASVASISQRLVRTLCTACRAVRQPDAILYQHFEALGVPLPASTYYDAVGCDLCEKQGYMGRIALAELLVVDGDLRTAIGTRVPSSRLRELAQAQGMVSLLASGVGRAAAGETTLSEVLRVAG